MPKNMETIAYHSGHLLARKKIGFVIVDLGTLEEINVRVHQKQDEYPYPFEGTTSWYDVETVAGWNPQHESLGSIYDVLEAVADERTRMKDLGMFEMGVEV